MKKFVGLLLWFRNFISPFLISLVLVFIVYLALGKSILGFIIAVFIVVIGASVGIIFSEKLRKKYKSDLFNAIPMATADLEHLHNQKSNHQ